MPYIFHFLWPPCVADANIIFESCGFFFYLPIFFSFLAESQPSQIGCLPYFHTGCGLMRIYDSGLKRAARSSLKTQDAKIAKNSPSAQYRTTLSGYRPIFATKACIVDNRKKTSLNT